MSLGFETWSNFEWDALVHIAPVEELEAAIMAGQDVHQPCRTYSSAIVSLIQYPALNHPFVVDKVKLLIQHGANWVEEQILERRDRAPLHRGFSRWKPVEYALWWILYAGAPDLCPVSTQWAEFMSTFEDEAFLKHKLEYQSKPLDDRRETLCSLAGI